MAKVTLVFNTQNADQYERVIREIGKQETALNNALAQTTLRMAGLAAPTQKQIDAYANLTKAEDAYAKASQKLAQSIGSGAATGDDLREQQAAAAAYKTALSQTNEAMDDHAKKTNVAAQAHQNFGRNLMQDRYSLIIAARGLAEFAGASRELTGAITSLSAVHDPLSAAFVGFGFALEVVTKQVERYDAAQDKAFRRTARGSATVEEFTAGLQAEMRDPAKLALTALRETPNLAGKLIENYFDALSENIAKVVSGNTFKGAAFQNLGDVISKSQVGLATDLYTKAVGTYGQEKAGAAAQGEAEQNLLVLAASNVAYDKLYTAVANYRREVGQASADKNFEAAAVFRATEMYQAQGKALQELHLIMTVQEESQLSLEAAFKGQAAQLDQTREKYRQLSEAMDLLGITGQAEISNNQKAMGMRDDEEIAIKRLIPTLLEYHRVQGDGIQTAEALRAEAKSTLDLASAREKLMSATMAAGSIQRSLNQLNAGHGNQLSNFDEQTADAAVESERRIGEQRIDVARHYQQALDDMDRSMGEQRAENARAFAVQMSDFDENTAKQRIQIDENTAKQREQIEENYQESIRRINENYAASLFDLVLRRDARGLVAASKARDQQIKDAAHARDQQNKDVTKNHTETLADLEKSIAEQKRLMERAHERQLEAMDRSAALQREHLAASNKRQQEETEIGLARQREAEQRSHAKALKNLNDAYAEQKAALEMALADELTKRNDALAAVQRLTAEGFSKASKEADTFMETVAKVAEATAEIVRKVLDPQTYTDFFQGLADMMNSLTPLNLTNPDTGIGPTAAAGAYTGNSTGTWTLHPNEVVLPLSNPGRMNELLQSYVYPSLSQSNVPSYAPGAMGGGVSGGGRSSAMVQVEVSLKDGLLDARIARTSEGVMASIVTQVERNLARGL